MAPKKVVLTYFDGKGRAESTRMALTYGGIKFEDKRLTFADWPAVKESTPYKSLPTLEVDGKVLGQSLAIFRYAAKLVGIAGKDDMDAAKQDAIVDAINDVQNKYFTLAFAKDDAAKEEAMKALTEAAGGLVKALEGQLGKDNFFGGSKLSYADIYLLCLVDALAGAKQDGLITDSKPLAAVVKRVKEDGKLKKYLAARKETQF